MEFYLLLIGFAALYPLTIYADYKEKQKLDADPEKEYDYNGQLSTMALLFIPYAVLFYTEQFWANLLLYIPLYIYCFGMLFYVYKKGYFAIPPMIAAYASPGQFMLVIIAYYLFFDEGVLSDTQTLSATTEEAIKQTEYAMWPYVTFVTIWLTTIASCLLERKERITPNIPGALIFLSIATLPTLPLFTHIYWWGLLASLVGFLTILFAMFGKRSDTGAGAGSAFFYFYMMTTMGSIILYAFLF